MKSEVQKYDRGIIKNGHYRFSGKFMNREDQRIGELIQKRRYQILINSCIYYEFNQNLVPDFVYDDWSRELYSLQNEYREISEFMPLHWCFKDWNPATGFDLPIREKWIKDKAAYILKIYGGGV